MEKSWNYQGPTETWTAGEWRISHEIKPHIFSIFRDGKLLQQVENLDTAHAWIRQQEAAERAEAERQEVARQQAEEQNDEISPAEPA